MQDECVCRDVTCASDRCISARCKGRKCDTVGATGSSISCSISPGETKFSPCSSPADILRDRGWGAVSGGETSAEDISVSSPKYFDTSCNERSGGEAGSPGLVGSSSQ